MIEAFAASHEPSPWMGDRQTFQVDAVRGDRHPAQPQRALAVPPRQRGGEAALLRRHVRERAQDRDRADRPRGAVPLHVPRRLGSSLLFRNVNERARRVHDRPGGRRRHRLVGRPQRPLQRRDPHVHVRDVRQADRRRAGSSGRPTRYARFDATDREHADRDVADQRRPGQAQPRARARSRPTPSRRSRRARSSSGTPSSSAIEVEGATEDQLTTLYSNLYRLVPVSQLGAREHRHGERAALAARRAVLDQHRAEHADADRRAGRGRQGLRQQRVLGHLPDHLVGATRCSTPTTPGELVDGFVQQYRDGGWIARWSSPGYANLMTGTSSDVSFADAYVKGVGGFDATRRLRRGAQERDRRAAGRPVRLQRRPQGPVAVAVPRLHAVARVRGRVVGARGQHQRLRHLEHGGQARRRDVGPEARSAATRRSASTSAAARTDYVNMFDPAVGFFQGRDANGRWKSAPEDYDPRVWGHEHDYTETDGWGFAFHAPQDGAGPGEPLRRPRRAGEEARRVLLHPGDRQVRPGSYGGTIHEMIEARDVRMGQWGFSNQVSHHIPYMYDYAGQPYKTRREGPRGAAPALRRLGDRAGLRRRRGQRRDVRLVPLQRARLLPAAGRQRELRDRLAAVQEGDRAPRRTARTSWSARPRTATRTSTSSGLKLNGAAIDRAYLRHSEIAGGGTLEFDMGPQPSKWATGADAAPPSITQGDQVAAAAARPDRRRRRRPPRPATRARCSTTTRARPRSPGAWVQYRFAAAQPVRFYTLTSGTEAGGDPSGWVVKGSNDGSSWTTSRRAQRRAVPLALADAAVQAARDRAATPTTGSSSPAAGATLGEVELLNPAAAGDRRRWRGQVDSGRGVGRGQPRRCRSRSPTTARRREREADGDRAGRADRHAGERELRPARARVRRRTVDAEGGRGRRRRARQLPGRLALTRTSATRATARRSP